MALLGHRNLLTTAAFYTLMNSHWAQKTTVGSFQERIHSIVRGEPERAPNTRDTGSGFIYIYIYMFVGVIISMSKELNFKSRTWVMVVKHVYVQLCKYIVSTKLSAETGKINCNY